ncbi:MAG TPA: Ig domain-containing protein [Gaiellaceae bacterium]|nr:Ig domain-containing protein [Gaiellaceae bacterium]
MRSKLALFAVAAFAVVGVSGASAADFDVDGGPCLETPGDKLLLRCPTAHVGEEYEIQIESEEGSGCEPYDWFEIVNGSLPAGLTLSRDGVISGVPTGGPGLSRFWVWNHDLTASQGGPSWCEREDRSEREFSIPVDPGLAIDNDSVKPATLGQPYSDTFTATQVRSLNPVVGTPVQAVWSLESGALPPGFTLSPAGVLTGTPAAEGSYGFVVRARNGSPTDSDHFTLTIRQAVTVKSPLAPGTRPAGEVGIRFGKTFTATGGSGTYTWALSAGALPQGVILDAAKGTIAGAPQAAGNFQFTLTATDSEGRVASVSAALTIAARLAVKTATLKPAKLGRAYRTKLTTVGGVQPMRWTVVRGTLPKGLRLTRSTGVIAGAPSRSGSFRVTFEARDALGAKARKALVFLVQAT